MEITSAFQGITTPVSDLYNEIHMRGWQVTRLDIKDGQYVAEASNPHGEKVSKTGRDQSTALGNLLIFIMRREHIRQGAWNKHWADQLDSIAQGYAKAPHFDPKAAAAWKELADDCVARAGVLAQQVQIELTHDPTPYATPQELHEDVQKNKHLMVSDANTEHPVWTRDQVIAFRICHDILGHAQAGAGWDWTGVNLATAAHMPYLTENAQRALFGETVGNAAYQTYHRGWGPKKITFLDDHLVPVQESENPDAHGGEHPSMTLAPSALPTRSSHELLKSRPVTVNNNEVLIGEPGRYHSDLSTDGQFKGRLYDDDSIDWYHEDVPNEIHSLVENQLGKSIRRVPWQMGDEAWHFGHATKVAANPCPKCGEREYEPIEYRQGDDDGYLWKGWHCTNCGHAVEDKGIRAVSGVLRDPNYQYETNIVPPAGNALTLYDDPLEHMKVKDHAHALHTGWSEFTDAEGKPDHERMKVAIMNAFRAALLSPLKELHWNAAHYQDISHIPYNVSDPKVYWDALENARINHNRAAGFPDPEVRHKEYYEALLDFYRYYARHNPELSPTEVKARADREVQVMQAEIEENLLADVKQPDAEILHAKVNKELNKRLKGIMKDDKPLHQGAALANPYDPDTKAYGAFIGRHLIAIAQLSKYADLLLEAALEDVQHGGDGHIFRAAVLRLNIPYVGPKVASFAWLLLQPLTSELATIDTHMCDVLGYDHKKHMNNRDYFKMERELMAGRDASGYGHMPLGQFQWGLWDYKRTGPHSHQDHTSLKPWQPTPHHQVDWKPRITPSPQTKEREWLAPDWWVQTAPYRDSEAAAWQHDVAVEYPKNQIPWSNKTVPVPHISSDGTDDEVHLALDVPEWVREKIARWLPSVGLKPSEILDPADYHITVAYADSGVNDIDVSAVKNNFNLTGLRFTSKGLAKFNDALVIELENSDFNEYAVRVNDWLEDQGISVSRHEGGYKPHITIAYTDQAAPDIDSPPLAFRAGAMSFSTPRKAPAIPSLWAKVARRALAFLGYECKVCHHDFGQEKPLWKNCPNCGASLYKDGPYDYNTDTYPADFTKPRNIVPKIDPNQMTLKMPLEVHAMPSSARSSFDGIYASRLTVGYDSLNNRLYVGPTGSYHAHCGRHFGVPMEEGEYDESGKLNGPGWFVGYVTLPERTQETTDLNEAREQGLLDGAVLGWYHRKPDADVQKELEDAIGIGAPAAGGPKAQTDDEMWEEADDEGLWDDDDEDDPYQINGKTLHDEYDAWGEVPVGAIVNNGSNDYKILPSAQKPYVNMQLVHDGTKPVEDGPTYPAVFLDYEVPGKSWTLKSKPEAQPEAQPQQAQPYKTFGDIPVNSVIAYDDGREYKIVDKDHLQQIDWDKTEDDDFNHGPHHVTGLAIPFTPDTLVPGNVKSVTPPDWKPGSKAKTTWMGEPDQMVELKEKYPDSPYWFVKHQDTGGIGDIHTNDLQQLPYQPFPEESTQQGAHFKVGDQVQPHTFAKGIAPNVPLPLTVKQFNQGIVTVTDANGGDHHLPEYEIKQFKQDEPPADHFGVFAHTVNGNRHRISDWIPSYDDALKLYDRHDYPTYGQPGYVAPEINGEAVTHFAVRTSNDPGWNKSPHTPLEPPPEPEGYQWLSPKP